MEMFKSRLNLRMLDGKDLLAYITMLLECTARGVWRKVFENYT